MTAKLELHLVIQFLLHLCYHETSPSDAEEAAGSVHPHFSAMDEFLCLLIPHDDAEEAVYNHIPILQHQQVWLRLGQSHTIFK